MTHRKINTDILKRIADLNPNSIQVDGVTVRTVATDKGLGTILGVSRQTIHAWRKAGIIPSKPMQSAPHIPMYRIKDVIGAIKEHSLSDLDYAVKMDEVHRQLDIMELKAKVARLEKIIENGQKEK